MMEKTRMYVFRSLDPEVKSASLYIFVSYLIHNILEFYCELSSSFDTNVSYLPLQLL